MNRITWHHTGGAHTPSAVDLRAYHRLIDGTGNVISGLHPISANAPGRRLTPGTYAAHTGGLNTGNIGIALCCMAGANERAHVASTAHPPTQAQVDALVRETARLCELYNINPDRRHVLSHAEVEPTLGVRQRGKWDFNYALPGMDFAGRNPVQIGDHLRMLVSQEIARPLVNAAPDAPRPTLRNGSRGIHVEHLQRKLRITADGIFGPQTDRAVRAFQAANELLPDGIVGPLTWGAL